MADKHNVFICWSGPRSEIAAEALKEWLPAIIQVARPWMSASDVDKGTRWREEVTTALDTVRAGIICLTPENLSSEWLLFESGALSKGRGPQTRTWTYLLAGLKKQDVKDPLAMFQATTAEKEDTRKLVHSLNKNLDSTVENNNLDYLFDKVWPDLEQRLANLPTPAGKIPPGRSTDEVAADTLELLRGVAHMVQNIASETEIRRSQRLAKEKLSSMLRRAGGAYFVPDLSSPGARAGAVSYNRISDIDKDLAASFDSSTPPESEPEETAAPPPSTDEQKPH
jgi:TIR domain